jgi:2-dehydropantoate 2-reductase
VLPGSMRVVVQGAGSLGSLVGGLLAATDAGVTLLGRAGDHLDAVERDGLRVQRADDSDLVTEPSVATDSGVVAAADLVVVCVKSYDTASAASDLGAHWDGADVLTLQNGLGNAEALAEHVPEAAVVAGTTTHGAVLESPGVVRHAGIGDTTIGRYFVDNDDAVDRIASVLAAAGMDATVTDDPERAVWTKVLVNAGINAATALARVDNGALVEAAPGERLLTRAVEEGANVARAAGVSVPGDVVERARTVARETASNHSSMRQDVEAGSRTEIEALNGELAVRAREYGVDAPVNETLADLIRLTASGD